MGVVNAVHPESQKVSENELPLSLQCPLEWFRRVSGLIGELFSFIYSMCLVFGLLTACYGELRWFGPHGERMISPDNACIGLGIFAGLWFLSQCVAPWLLRRESGLLGRIGRLLEPVLTNFIALRLHSGAFIVGIILLLSSDFVYRRFGFYISPGVRSEMLFAGVIGSVLAIRVFRWAPTGFLFSWPMLICAQILCAVLFLEQADGRMLFSDDHPSFLYRLLLLRENFPNIPFYNTDWNAGYSAREFYPSGVLNVFFLSAPFLYLAGISPSFSFAQYYLYLIPYLYIFLIPWSVYAAGRILGFGRQPALLAALLSLAPSLGYLEWLLKYGTLGFATSVGLIPLTFALCYRLALDSRPPKWRHAVLLIVSASLCLNWTLSGIALLPVMVIALMFPRHLCAPERLSKIVFFVFFFVLLNASWMSTFVAESKVLRFVSGGTLPGTHSSVETSAKSATIHSKASTLMARIEKGSKRFRQDIVKVNPLLLLLFVPGLVFVRSRTLCVVLGMTVGFLLLVAAIGEPLKPQLELRRMIIPASFLMTLLGGLAIYSLGREFMKCWIERSRTPIRSWISFVACVVLLGATILSPITGVSAYQNRSDEKFRFEPKEAQGLSDAISAYGGSGRTFFLGFILHELGSQSYQTQDGGHIAPLAFFSGKPLYASHYYHKYWSSVDPIPGSYRLRGEAGIEEFLNLVNATAVITFKREWVEYCQKRSWYRQVFRQGRFRLFIREGDSVGYFLKGSGATKRVFGGITVNSSDDNVVLKYRYLPKLKIRSSSEKLELYSVKVFDEDVGGGKTEEVFYIGIRRLQAESSSFWSADIGY